MKITRGDVQLEQTEIVLHGRGYRVTGSPTLAQDKYAMVEVFVAEGRAGGWHWRRLRSGPRKDEVRVAAMSGAKPFSPMRGGDQILDTPDNA